MNWRGKVAGVEHHERAALPSPPGTAAVTVATSATRDGERRSGGARSHRPRWHRRTAATAVFLAAVGLPSSPASASPPGNDERASATFVSAADAQYYIDYVETTEATASAEEDLQCHDSAATVWYLVEGTGNQIGFDTYGSEYDTAIAVAEADGSLIACSDVGPALEPEAAQIVPTVQGQSYLVMVGAARGGTGGQMKLTIVDLPPYEEPPPPPPPGDPPANDALVDATVLTQVPTTVAEDTTGATSDGIEPGMCGAHKSVWFRFTPDANRHVAMDTLGSDYDTQIGVYEERAGVLNQIACNRDALGTTQSRVELDVAAGTSYVILVTHEYRFDTFPPTGGWLVLNAAEVTPFEVTVTIDDEGGVYQRQGLAVVSGTVTCSRPAEGGVSVRLQQGSGERLVVGYGSAAIDDCTTPARFEALVFPWGSFRPGPAIAEAVGQGTSLDIAARASSTEPVRLRPTE